MTSENRQALYDATLAYYKKEKTKMNHTCPNCGMELAHLETACPACNPVNADYTRPNYAFFQPPKDFRQLQDHVRVWQEHNFPLALPHQPLLGIGEEIGELNHAHLKREQNIRGGRENFESDALDALGDAMVYMADYCNRNGLQLEDGVELAWDTIKQRDWKQFPKNGKTE